MRDFGYDFYSTFSSVAKEIKISKRANVSWRLDERHWIIFVVENKCVMGPFPFISFEAGQG